VSELLNVIGPIMGVVLYAVLPVSTSFAAQHSTARVAV
jgi:hypothetical protein